MTATLNTQDPDPQRPPPFHRSHPRPDAPDWWRVPPHKAPAQGAYAMHELIPAGSGAGRVVTVNLRGLADSARGADWRASFIAVSDTGVERYTPLWSHGSSSITLAAMKTNSISRWRVRRMSFTTAVMTSELSFPLPPVALALPLRGAGHRSDTARAKQRLDRRPHSARERRRL
jgi:hypothetical protein